MRPFVHSYRNFAFGLIVATAVNERNKGKALGADAYLVKPITRDDLMSSLDRLVDVPEEDA